MSTSPRSIEELEDPEHLRHQRWEWLGERIGWGLIAGVLTAAIAGLVGPGPLSSRRVASGDGSLAVEYDAFQRSQAPAVLRIRVRPETLAGDLDLALSRTLTDATKLEQIVPEPVVSKLDDGQLILSFRATDLEQGEIVLYRYQYERFGSFRHRIRLAGRQPVEIQQWVFP